MTGKVVDRKIFIQKRLEDLSNEREELIRKYSYELIARSIFKDPKMISMDDNEFRATGNRLLELIRMEKELSR